MEKILFYDIEVFSHDCLIVFKDIDKNIVGAFWSKPDQNVFEAIPSLIQGCTIVGYNNYFYDNVILWQMLNKTNSAEDIKIVNDALIKDSKLDAYRPDRRDIKNRFKTLDVICLDAFQQIDVSMPSLKFVEGNMGISIEETSIPFDYPHKLTDRQKAEVMKYCCHDIDATIEVYKKRKESYFDVKEELLGLMDQDIRYKKNADYWGTNTISAKVLMPGVNGRNHDIRDHLQKDGLGKDGYIPLSKWRDIPELPNEVFDMWEKWVTDFHSNSNKLPKSNSMSIKKYGVEFIFGFGGLHGVPVDDRRKYTDVKLLDVGSMYPTMITVLKAMGCYRNGKIIGDDIITTYDGLRKKRLSIKKSDPTQANALKLVLNSVYGNLKYQYSPLYHPIASTAICAYGQMALFDLCRRLFYAGYTLVNINTDGVGFVDDRNIGNETYETIWHEWEDSFSMTLELDEFKTWIQKDVNNYIAVGLDGHIKTKGGECNKYSKDEFFKNNNLRIVQIAMVEYMLHGVHPMDTINKHLDEPRLYQYVLRAGRTYKGVCDAEGNTDYQNINRVFACKSKYSMPKLYKQRQDGGLVNFPDLPENVYLYNGDTSEFEDFKEIVDKQHYVNLVWKKVKGWGISM